MENQPVVQALIRTTPPVRDKRELESIVTTSLIKLFGDYQPYSCGFRVVECRPSFSLDDEQAQNPGQSYDSIIECPLTSLEYVRAALTFSSVPSFLEGEVYRIDFIRTVHEE
jgi:RNase P/RNase MRP subunit POP5